MTPSILRIATRKSALALWQAEHVADLLRARYPSLTVELVPMTTRGDEVQDRSLASIGGKGLFLKELEIALLEGHAELAVHSLKDVPANLDPGFELTAILPRADAADAFVSNQYASLAELPAGARVGTSSLRRRTQVRALRPDMEILDLRGNVGTRLAKLDAGTYDAIVLACAGLQRLGLGARIRSRLTPPDWLPAPGQAAIAIETCGANTDVQSVLTALDDRDTRLTVTAERAMNRALGGSCTIPIGAWCVHDGSGLQLLGMVGDPDTGHLLRAEAKAAASDASELGEKVANLLLAQGAGKLLGL